MMAILVTGQASGGHTNPAGIQKCRHTVKKIKPLTKLTVSTTELLLMDLVDISMKVS